jgi:hypothetical protein
MSCKMLIGPMAAHTAATQCPAELEPSHVIARDAKSPSVLKTLTCAARRQEPFGQPCSSSLILLTALSGWKSRGIPKILKIIEVTAAFLWSTPLLSDAALKPLPHFAVCTSIFTETKLQGIERNPFNTDKAFKACEQSQTVRLSRVLLKRKTTGLGKLAGIPSSSRIPPVL